VAIAPNGLLFAATGDDVGEDRREEVDMKPLRKAHRQLRLANLRGHLRFRPGHIAHHDKPVHQ